MINNYFKVRLAKGLPTAGLFFFVDGDAESTRAAWSAAQEMQRFAPKDAVASRTISVWARTRAFGPWSNCSLISGPATHSN